LRLRLKIEVVRVEDQEGSRVSFFKRKLAILLNKLYSKMMYRANSRSFQAIACTNPLIYTRFSQWLDRTCCDWSKRPYCCWSSRDKWSLCEGELW